ncbi:Basic proline-rich protein precursor [[Actinomadura] parvosata subsp. kistnae]|nr:Basic proline-rich protein precursor [Actinomadura parvosata subsp. kistnae]
MRPTGRGLNTRPPSHPPPPRRTITMYGKSDHISRHHSWRNPRRPVRYGEKIGYGRPGTAGRPPRPHRPGRREPCGPIREAAHDIAADRPTNVVATTVLRAAVATTTPPTPPDALSSLRPHPGSPARMRLIFPSAAHPAQRGSSSPRFARLSRPTGRRSKPPSAETFPRSLNQVRPPFTLEKLVDVGEVSRGSQCPTVCGWMWTRPRRPPGKRCTARPPTPRLWPGCAPTWPPPGRWVPRAPTWRRPSRSSRGCCWTRPTAPHRRTGPRPKACRPP